ncbi:MAG: type II secretion system protein GspN [Bdellovibrionales bacterium]|nr:type II secretion system protein GspN [Bdellovibrionales bacterium]
MSEIADTAVQSNPNSTTRSISKMLGLGFLFLGLILLFTLFKLPEAKITALIQGYVQTSLDPFGIYISDRGRSLSLITGIRYRLDHPTLELRDQTRIELDELEVRPKLLSLLTGRAGATADLRQGKSTIHLDLLAKSDRIEADLALNDVDLARFGFFAFAGIKGSGAITGKSHVDGSPSDLATLNGGIDLRLKNVQLEEQMIIAFKIPSISISEGTVNVEIKGGKLLMKNVQLGRQNDDVTAALTGDLALNRNLNSSPLNLRVLFSLSPKTMASLSFMESLISGAKQSDGKYAYKLTGTISSPFANPDPQN